MEELKNILEKSCVGVESMEGNLYRVNYGDSFMKFKHGEFRGNHKPIRQRIIVLVDSDVDDILEELNGKVKIGPEDMGPIKNEINIHARGKVNEYIDREMTIQAGGK